MHVSYVSSRPTEAQPSLYKVLSHRFHHGVYIIFFHFFIQLFYFQIRISGSSNLIRLDSTKSSIMVARLTLAAIDRKKCVAQIPGLKGIYGYDPSLAAGIVLCVLFGSSMLLHTFTAVRYRVWWQIVLAVGALCKISILSHLPSPCKS